MRYMMTFSYDGSKYNGYQKQPNIETIQSVLEDKLTQINSNNKVNVSASGRTDSGVHALNQKAHFDLKIELPVDRLKHSLNKMLPPSIYVKDIKIVSEEFHARFDVKRKKYVYKINVGEYNPLDADYIYQYNNELNIEKMSLGIKEFIGTHDFTSYTKGCEEKEDYVRTIYEAYVIKENDIIEITFIGNGFLRYMVRNMVGSLIEIGSGKMNASDIANIIEKKDRKCAGLTAPSCGLYLVDVEYEK